MGPNRVEGADRSTHERFGRWSGLVTQGLLPFADPCLEPVEALRGREPVSEDLVRSFLFDVSSVDDEGYGLVVLDRLGPLAVVPIERGQLPRSRRVGCVRTLRV